MTKISISYRRKDSDAITGRIFDRLVTHYGANAVFRDIDNIPPGYDFRKYISGALEDTDILLAIVGPQWTGKTEGRTRIHEITDLVRIEIEAALRKDIPVVPLLVGNATMPDPSELPDTLKDFAFRNAVKVDALEDFDDHLKRLIRNLDRLLETRGKAPLPDNSSERSTPDRSSATPPPVREPVDPAGPPTSGDLSPKRVVPDERHARPGPDQLKEEAKPSHQSRPTSIGSLLILPAIVIALYAVLFISGAWNLGQTLTYTPALPLAQAVLFSFCIARYGRVSVTQSLLGAAALWLASSALLVVSGLASSTMLSSIAPASRGLYTIANGTITSALFAAVIMAIGAWLCPILRRGRYWTIALIGYPLIFLLANSAVPALATSSDRSTLTTLYFGTVVLRQTVLFGFLGYWVSRSSPQLKAKPLLRS
jgi:TIR domain